MKNLRKLICFLSLIFIFILGPISVSASGTISENNANYNKYSIQLSTEDENGIIYRVFNEASNLDLRGSSDFVITEVFSEYTTYLGDMKVIEEIEDGEQLILSPGVDYIIKTIPDGFSISFIGDIKPSAKYIVSYNVQTNENAVSYYEMESKVQTPVVQDVQTRAEEKIVINTVFDNYDEYSSEIDALAPGYRAVSISEMRMGANYYTPAKYDNWNLSINRGKDEFSTMAIGNNEYVKSISFDGYAHNISLNVSLDSIEYIDNARPYEIPFLGIDNSFRIKTSNWVEIIEPGEYTEITLHFKYIPNLPPYESADIMPNIEHSKYIDYLGDTVVNPDTHVSGENDYRVYNNITSLSDITTEDNLADIVFILDTSGSMSLTLDGKYRIDILKEIMNETIDNLIDANPNNRISIISMGTFAKLEISGSSDKDNLKNKVKALTTRGATNYSGAINIASAEVEKLKASSTDERDTTVIFLTDGEPTVLAVPNPAAAPVEDYIPLAAAYEAMGAFPQIDNFYSMFISSFDGAASNLQTLTQLANVTGEKNVVKGDSEEEIESMINRFVAKYTGPVTDVSISDKLSSKVTYTGDLKVIATSLDGKTTTLSPGVDYEFTKMSNELIVSFKNELKEDTTYSFSYNIRGSDEAMIYYEKNQTYPHIGDFGTDYPGNETSSDKPGFYSSDESKVIYKISSGDVELIYDKPVIQVVPKEKKIVINTVFDNYAEYSSEIDALAPGYKAELIVSLKPDVNGHYSFIRGESNYLKINDARTEYSTIVDKYGEYVESLFFDGYSFADGDRSQFNSGVNVSLASVECLANAKPYAFPVLGLDNSARINSMNWVEVIEPGEYTEVTLHFKYIPNIAPYETDIPRLGYSKTIDYLGDSIANPDTTVSGENAYRVYNDVNSFADIEVEEKLVDTVFILDISGSMSSTLNGISRLGILKKAMNSIIDSLIDANPNNRISIVTLQSYSELKISGSSDKQELKNIVEGLKDAGGTNYHDAINIAATEVEQLKSTATDTRDTSVIFITDGRPNISNFSQSSAENSPLATAYEAMESFPQVDNFYSMFIDADKGSASNLQTMTQLVNVTGEKNAVEGNSSVELERMMSRFVAKYIGPVADIAISDKLSQNVTYTGDLKIIHSTHDGIKTILSPGIDYTFTNKSNELVISFKNGLKEYETYSFSYNVRGSDSAMTYYAINQTYPDIGDSGTDYMDNNTSSGMPGFYSSDETNLLTSGNISMAYDKPVIQVVESEEGIIDKIVLAKELENKTLTEGMFEFEIKNLQDGTTQIVKNDADGNIKYPSSIQKPGTYNFQVREVIPTDGMKGMTYDTKVIPINATVLYKNGELVSQILYPNGRTFYNKYYPLRARVNLTAKKVLNGKALTKDMFKFNLFDSSNKLVSTVTNDGAGDIKFGTLTFSKPGEYIYKMSESIPMPADPFVEYDLSNFTAKITVVDNNGQLEAKVEMSQEPIFVNTYFIPSVTNAIEVDLILTGMQLTANAFTFEIKEFDKFNNLIDTKEVKNQANGKITADYTYDEEGVYTYLIDQVIPRPKNDDDYIKNMDFDEETILVTVTVTRGANSLVTSTTYEKLDGKEPKFYNRYKVRGGIW